VYFCSFFVIYCPLGFRLKRPVFKCDCRKTAPVSKSAYFTIVIDFCDATRRDVRTYVKKELPSDSVYCTLSPRHHGFTSTHCWVLYVIKLARNDPVIPHSQNTMYNWNRWTQPLYSHCFWVIMWGNNYITRRGIIHSFLVVNIGY
jgi:hypothetical protein